jgi:shikimate dehydrogenase
MEITGTTEVYGLIGSPVAHSISPLIHNMLAKKTGLDMTYVCFPVAGRDVRAALEGAFALGIRGMNVTVPHKQSVRALLSSVDPLADAVGAVNTLVRDGDGFTGYNTDVEGFAREAAACGILLQGAGVVVVGAGGAARGVCFSLAKEGAGRIVIANRTKEKAGRIADAVNSWKGETLVIPAGMDILSDTEKLKSLAGSGYLAVQTTSVGLYPDTESSPVDDPEFFAQAAAGIDIIYNPEETRFMKYMRQAGHPAYNGLLMLLYQGIASFELWTGRKVPKEAADEVYAAMQQEMAGRRK